MPAVAQAGVMRWPLHRRLQPRRRAQDPAAPGVEPGFAPAHQLKNDIFLCVRVLEVIICLKFS